MIYPTKDDLIEMVEKAAAETSSGIVSEWMAQKIAESSTPAHVHMNKLAGIQLLRNNLIATIVDTMGGDDNVSA